jgi:hypothetical protein
MMVTDGDACCQQAFLRRASFDYIYRTYDLHSVSIPPPCLPS